MKKLGKKISFLTKVMLVVGLLISNLSSLTYAFASEVTEDVVVTLIDDSLEIKYLGEVADGVESVKVKVTEKYTYLDETFITSEEVNSFLVTEFLANGVTQPSIIAGEDPAVYENVEVFDGLYEVVVEITDLEGNPIDSAIYSKNVEHESGLEIKLYDESDSEIIALENGKYPVSDVSSEVKAVAKVLAGGLAPTDLFKYEDQEYFALQLVDGLVFDDYSYDFSGLLYGDYNTQLSVELLKKVKSVEPGSEEEYEDVVISENLGFAYENYSKNAEILNRYTQRLSLDSVYHFIGDSKNGVMFALLDLSDEAKARTMLDLYNIANGALDGADRLSFVLSNSSSDDILKSYEELTAPVTPGADSEVQVVAETEQEELTLEEYLSEIKLDNSTSLKLIGETLNPEEKVTLTYNVAVVGDVDKNNKLDENDLSKLIEEIVFEEVSDELSSNVGLFDDEVNTLDVMYLNEILKNKDWNANLEQPLPGELLARLDVSDGELTSGDTFTVQYVLSLADYDVNGLAGLFKYNKEVFELVSMDVDSEWLGANKDGKFLYITDEKLTAPEEVQTDDENQETTTPEQDETGDENQEIVTADVPVEGEDDTEEETPVVTEDYVILTATFKALKASSLEDGNVIAIEEIELFNDNVYMDLDVREVESDVIVVNADTNNRLASLKVAGQEIELLEDVYEYRIVVANDVTVAEIEYVLESTYAKVTSIVSPEELVEGDNKITITVVSESGLEQTYTVVVTREAAPKKEVVYTDNYYGDYDNDQEEEVIVTPGATEEVEPEEKSGILSRIIIIVLILLVIAGLIYLIFKDEKDPEAKKANKEIDKLKKEDNEPVVQKTTKNVDNSPKKKKSKK